MRLGQPNDRMILGIAMTVVIVLAVAVTNLVKWVVR